MQDNVEFSGNPLQQTCNQLWGTCPGGPRCWCLGYRLPAKHGKVSRQNRQKRKRIKGKHPRSGRQSMGTQLTLARNNVVDKSGIKGKGVMQEAHPGGCVGVTVFWVLQWAGLSKTSQAGLLNEKSVAGRCGAWPVCQDSRNCPL